jgi:hypothetical protein
MIDQQLAVLARFAAAQAARLTAPELLSTLVCRARMRPLPIFSAELLPRSFF